MPIYLVSGAYWQKLKVSSVFVVHELSLYHVYEDLQLKIGYHCGIQRSFFPRICTNLNRIFEFGEYLIKKEDPKKITPM
jgi:hypothetical protein